MVSLGSLLLVCYYTNWAQYRTGQGKFTPSNIDPNLYNKIFTFINLYFLLNLYSNIY